MVTWVAAGKLAFYNYINMVGQTTTLDLNSMRRILSGVTSGPLPLEQWISTVIVDRVHYIGDTRYGLIQIIGKEFDLWQFSLTHDF